MIDLRNFRGVPPWPRNSSGLGPDSSEEEIEENLARLMAEGKRNAGTPFFEQAAADADFEYWGKAAYWTLDEAVALSLSKSPEVVNWTLLEPLVGSSQFAAGYGRRRELTIRAKTQGQLVDPVLPQIFLAWAKQIGISIPSDLQTAVDLTQTPVTDWKSRYETLEASFNEQRARWVNSSQEKDQEIERLRSEHGKMQRQLNEATQRGLSANERRANTRERSSLLRIVIGLASAIYCYDPEAKKDDVATQIQGDLDLVGLKIDQNTIRKYLDEAAQLYKPTPPERPASNRNSARR